MIFFSALFLFALHNYSEALKRDSTALKMFKEPGDQDRDLKMNDWESVISKDKSEEWVTLCLCKG